MIELTKCTGSGLTVDPVNECPRCHATFLLMDLEGGALPAHTSRSEPSARYYPRIRDWTNSAILHGAALSGMREEQVIDMLAAENHDLRARLMRALELNGVPMAIVVEARGGK